VDQGETQLPTNRRQMSVGLQPGLGEGRYIVHWSTLDDTDGDTLAGCYVFFVGQAAADASIQGGEPLDGGSRCPAVADEATPTPGEDGHDAEGESDGDGVPVWTLAIAIVGGVIVGGVGGRYLAAH
jgi:hypothetical protein